MARVHRAIGDDSCAPMSTDNTALTTQLQVTTTQVNIIQILKKRNN